MTAQDDHSAFLGMLAHKLNASGTHLLAGSPGAWSVRASDCVKPRLWLLLYGQVRTFEYTRRNLLALATMSSSTCSFVVGLAAPTICDADATPGMCVVVKNVSNGAPLRWDAFAPAVDSVAHASYSAGGARRSHGLRCSAHDARRARLCGRSQGIGGRAGGTVGVAAPARQQPCDGRAAERARASR
jgi:hypothetical protein